MRGFRPGEPNELHGIPAETIATWCGCHVTTARRWKRGEEPPRSALEIIRLRNTGDLGTLDPAWAGWCIVNGQLVSPEQTPFTPGDVRAGPFWRRLAHAYQVDQRLPQQADWVEAKWTVNEISEAVG